MLIVALFASVLCKAAALSTTAPGSAKSASSLISDLQQEHDDEFEKGSFFFGSSGGRTSESRTWSDSDFIGYSVGIGCAGPDENLMSNGAEVFESLAPVLTAEECDELIEDAREAIATGLAAEPRSFGRERTNSELGEARVSTLPRARKLLSEALQGRLFPLLESRFGIDDELTVYDALILGAHAPSRSQPVHRDASLVTLNIALSPSDSYVGGGTYFEGLEGGPMQIEQGHLLCHASGTMHAGVSISSGERWVLVVFLIAKNNRQLARRSHAHGLRAFEKGRIDEAAEAFEAGLNVAPRDHLLHTGLARVCSERGDKLAAVSMLSTAGDEYPLCQKALIGSAKMMLEQRRPRAALRRLDKALQQIDDRDLLEDSWIPLRATGWDARVEAAKCALLCAEYEAATKDRKLRSWSEARLPEAIERLRIALVPAPQDRRLRGMLARAETLLEEARRS